MKKVFLGLIACGALFMTSCTTYTPLTATSNPVGNKCGTASHWNCLFLFSGGNNLGINKAAKTGGISQISHIDVKKYTFLGLYNKTTVLVYGE